MIIAVVVEGRLVQGVLHQGAGPVSAVLAIDYDTEGAEPSELTDVNGRLAYVRMTDTEPSKIDLAKIIEQLCLPGREG